jgi:hypothetical protein
MLEFHKDGDCFGIETTITNPDEFIQACSDLLEKHIDLNSFDGDWAFQLRGWLPQIASMYNHLGGLKLNPEVKTYSTTLIGFKGESSESFILPQ